MTLLRIGKHRIVKNIALLRKVNIAHPYTTRDVRPVPRIFTFTKKWHSECPNGNSKASGKNRPLPSAWRKMVETALFTVNGAEITQNPPSG